MPEYFAIGPIDYFKIGDYGATEGNCLDVGDFQRVELAVSSSSTDAVDKYGIAHNAAVYDLKWTMKVTGTEMQIETLAKAWGGTVDASGNLLMGLSKVGPVGFHTVYSAGWQADGSKQKITAHKCYITPNTTVGVDKSAQHTYELDITLMADTTKPAGEEFFNMKAWSVDGTAPAVTGVIPANHATGVPKGVGTTVQWAFDSAIQAADMDDQHFLVVDDSGVAKAGTLSLGSDDAVVTFTPTAAWSPTTQYHCAVIRGVRDLGNLKLAANYLSEFTTGA